MRSKAIVSTVITALLAAVGYFLRAYALAGALDASGLPVSGALPSLVQWGFTAAAVLILLLIGPRGLDSTGDYAARMGSRSPLYMTLALAAGFVCLGSGAVWLRELASTGRIDTMELFLPLLVLLTGLSWIALSVSAFRGRELAGMPLFAFLPVLGFCCLMIFTYREVSVTPAVFLYVFRLLAPIAAALAFYYSAGFVFARPRAGRALAALRLTALFSAMTLADGHGLAGSLLYIFTAMAALISGFCLINSAEN